MNFLAGYADSDDEIESAPANMSTATNVLTKKLNSAPQVSTFERHFQSTTAAFNKPVDPTSLTIAHNPTAAAIWTPAEGPANPYKVVKANVTATVVESQAFDEQFHTFNHHQAAIDPGTGHLVVGPRGTSAPFGVAAPRPKRRRKQSKDEEQIDLGNEEESGPWAAEKPNIQVANPERSNDPTSDLSESQLEYQRKLEARREEQKRTSELNDADAAPEYIPEPVPRTSSEFFGTEERDYQGRSWIAPPYTLKASDGDHDCFTPKKLVHTWTGHKKGVQSIEFLPKYGNLLLSGSMDTTVRIWDVYNDKRCMRTYNGHSGAVKDINFSNDGSQFLSCSYDKTIKLWDTETGTCKGSYSNRNPPFSVRFYPIDNNIFVAAMGNNAVVQWDCRTGSIVQEYKHHLNAVNSVTFVDEGRRFVSTSDDKKMLVWEWNIPVPIKYITEPDMYSIPAVTVHPSGGYLAGQSMDNQIKLFETGDKTKLTRKRYKGHIVSGFACKIGFSPNGKFIMSGDAKGKLWFWDFKTCRNVRKLDAHASGPCIDSKWHPIEPSKVATCGWDGLIKYWD